MVHSSDPPRLSPRAVAEGGRRRGGRMWDVALRMGAGTGEAQARAAREGCMRASEPGRCERSQSCRPGTRRAKPETPAGASWRAVRGVFGADAAGDAETAAGPSGEPCSGRSVIPIAVRSVPGATRGFDAPGAHVERGKKKGGSSGLPEPPPEGVTLRLQSAAGRGGRCEAERRRRAASGRSWTGCPSLRRRSLRPA